MKTIEIYKIQSAYVATKNKDLLNILKQECEIPSQTKKVEVPDNVYNSIININEANKHFVKIIKLSRLENIIHNILVLGHNVSSYPCLTYKNEMFMNLYKDIKFIKRIIVENFRDIEDIIFYNTDGEYMCFVRKTCIDNFINFENKNGFVLGFFENNFAKVEAEEILDCAKYNGACQAVMYEKNHIVNANMVGISQLLYLFGKRSNNKKYIYISNEEILNNEKSVCWVYQNDVCWVYQNNTQTIIDDYKIENIDIENIPVISLSRLQLNPEIINTDLGEKEIDKLLSYNNEMFQKVVHILTTFALPYDAKCVLTMIMTLVNKFNTLSRDELKKYIFSEIKDDEISHTPEYKELSKVFLKDANTVIKVWQFLNDFVYEISVRGIIIMQNLKELESGIPDMFFKRAIFNIDVLESRKTQNNIVKNENNKEDKQWCDFDCHLCSARKKCDLHNDLPKEVLEKLPNIFKGKFPTPAIIIVKKVNDNKQTDDNSEKTDIEYLNKILDEILSRH